MKNTKNQKNPWIYDGKPEYVDLNVTPMSASEGGYVVAMELASGAVRIAATRQPAKYAASWSGNVKRFGVPQIVRMMVSKPFLRYEKIKRVITKAMSEYRDREVDSYHLSIDTMTAKAKEVFDTAGP